MRERGVDDQSEIVLATATYQFGLNLMCDGLVHPRIIGC